LQGLEQVAPQLRTIAELKVFEGLSMEEIAGQLDIPVRTAYRRWTFARTCSPSTCNSAVLPI